MSPNIKQSILGHFSDSLDARTSKRLQLAKRILKQIKMDVKTNLTRIGKEINIKEIILKFEFTQLYTKYVQTKFVEFN